VRIDEIMQENEELQEELLKLSNKKICASCNTKIEDGTSFCSSCGEKQPDPELEPISEPAPDTEV